VFIGAGAQTGTEGFVYEIMSANANFGHFVCAAPKATGAASTTFTLHQCVPSGGNICSGGPTTVATCTVATGAVSGSSTGTFSLVAGDIYDVQVTTGNTAGGVTASLGP